MHLLIKSIFLTLYFFMYKLLSILVFACFFMVACEQDSSSSSSNTTPEGHVYQLHRDAGGTKPNPGDYVVFDAYMRNGDSVIFSTKMQGQAPTIQIPTADVTRQVSPIEDLLKVLGQGRFCDFEYSN